MWTLPSIVVIGLMSLAVSVDSQTAKNATDNIVKQTGNDTLDYDAIRDKIITGMTIFKYFTNFFELWAFQQR